MNYKKNAVSISHEFEILLMELSASFINVDSESLDTCISGALQSIVTFLDVDRGTIGQFDPEQGLMHVTHCYAVNGIDTHGPTIGEQHVPYLTRQIRAGKPFVCNSVDNLPTVATTDKEFGQAQGVKSAVAVPLAAGGITLGLVSFSILRTEREWSETIVRRLQLLGEIFANALLRRNKEKELTNACAEIKKLKELAEDENMIWREQAVDPHFNDIIGESDILKEMWQKIRKVASTDSTVLLLGETGTGKELFASAIHKYSQRNEHPLIKVNCAALSSSLIESELFGYEKGAFTGALKTKPSRFEIANGGTILLDEIGEIDLDIQSKLLRLIQFGEFERVGSSKTRYTDARIIASTNRDLENMVCEGTFRKDLYYRLSVFPITIPPLRERKDDIPFLVAYIVDRLRSRLGRKINRIPDEVITRLVAHDWPGNIRELENIIERSMIVSTGSTLVLSNPITNIKSPIDIPIEPSISGSLNMQTLDEVQREHVRAVCNACKWKIDGDGNAADVLGINPNTLRSRMNKLGILRPGKK